MGHYFLDRQYYIILRHTTRIREKGFKDSVWLYAQAGPKNLLFRLEV